MIGLPLRLRPPRLQDAEAFRLAQEEFQLEDFEFAFGWDQSAPFSVFIQSVDDRSQGKNLPPDWVPETFLVAVVNDGIVGRISIRHSLNDHLRMFGGHIGYGIGSKHRRRGYATEVLRQGLIVARSVGIDDVLVTCDDENVGSFRTIEANGGVLEDLVDRPGGGRTRRYWIR